MYGHHHDHDRGAGTALRRALHVTRRDIRNYTWMEDDDRTGRRNKRNKRRQRKPSFKSTLIAWLILLFIIAMILSLAGAPR